MGIPVCGYTGVWIYWCVVYWCVGILVCGVATRGREAPTRDAAKPLVYNKDDPLFVCLCVRYRKMCKLEEQIWEHRKYVI